jgi:hypothetical protein
MYSKLTKPRKKHLLLRSVQVKAKLERMETNLKEQGNSVANHEKQKKEDRKEDHTREIIKVAAMRARQLSEKEDWRILQTMPGANDGKLA